MEVSIQHNLYDYSDDDDKEANQIDIEQKENLENKNNDAIHCSSV